MKKVGLGIIGCGNISEIYLKNLGSLFEHVNLIGCADLDDARAEEKARTHGIKAFDIEALLNQPEIDIVINLTIPAAHFDVSRQVLNAGKHVYSEKPIALNRNDGMQLLEMAKASGLRIGCAPDTFLGAGFQTSARLVEQGAIGTPLACQAFMLSHGPESWHPNPEFYYQKGGGPLLDMGPYYLTALVAMFGPVKSVAGMTQISTPQRTITSEPKRGKVIDVEVPTHSISLLKFDSGLIVTLTTSFDVWASKSSGIEIFGTEGVIRVPDPNTFCGPVCLSVGDHGEWVEQDILYSFDDNSRGVGVAEMALAIMQHRPHRASAEMALHVLDVMQATQEASDSGRTIDLQTSCPGLSCLVTRDGKTLLD